MRAGRIQRARGGGVLHGVLEKCRRLGNGCRICVIVTTGARVNGVAGDCDEATRRLLGFVIKNQMLQAAACFFVMKKEMESCGWIWCLGWNT